MRLPLTFSRWKGGGGTPALGSDTVPNGASGTPGTPPDVAADNVVLARITNPGGYAGLSVLVAYNFLGAASSTVSVAAWAWDSSSSRWYRLGAGTVAKDGMLRLGSASPGCEPMTDLSRPSVGDIAVAIIVTDGGSAAAGQHVFGVGLDASKGA